MKYNVFIKDQFWQTLTYSELGAQSHQVALSLILNDILNANKDGSLFDNISDANIKIVPEKD
jgi:hypothetical protein